MSSTCPLGLRIIKDLGDTKRVLPGDDADPTKIMDLIRAVFLAVALVGDIFLVAFRFLLLNPDFVCGKLALSAAVSATSITL